MQNLRIAVRGSRLFWQENVANISNIRRASICGSVFTHGECSEVSSQFRPNHLANFRSRTPVRLLASVAEADINLVEPVEVKPTVKKTEVTYEELVSLIEMGSVHLYDVREPSEIQETGIIKSAVNIPLTKLKASLQLDAAQFRANFDDARPPMDDPNIIFYGFCSIKSMAAVEIAQKLGFKRARHFPGGWQEWSRHHPPVQQTQPQQQQQQTKES